MRIVERGLDAIPQLATRGGVELERVRHRVVRRIEREQRFVRGARAARVELDRDRVDERIVLAVARRA